MTVYIDNIQQYSSGPWCHMAPDSGLDELHAIAARIGLKREWFQDHHLVPHYDLRPSKRGQAIKAGAVAVNQFELLILCCDHYEHMRTKVIERLASDFDL